MCIVHALMFILQKYPVAGGLVIFCHCINIYRVFSNGLSDFAMPCGWRLLKTYIYFGEVATLLGLSRFELRLSELLYVEGYHVPPLVSALPVVALPLSPLPLSLPLSALPLSAFPLPLSSVRFWPELAD